MQKPRNKEELQKHAEREQQYRNRKKEAEEAKKETRNAKDRARRVANKIQKQQEKQLGQALESSDMERQQLLATVDELKRQLEAEKEKSLGLLDAELKAKEDMERKFTALEQHSKETISRLKVEKVQLEDSLQSLELEKEGVIAEKDAFATKTSELQQRIEQAKNGKKGQSAENARIAFELVQMEGEMQDFTGEKQQLEAEVDALTQKHKAVLATVDELKHQLEA
jgi:chromosome segregation ATPase